MADIPAKDMVDVRNVALLREIIPIVEAEVEIMARTVENRVLSDSNRGELTPEKALNAWHEKLAMRRLVMNLQQKARIGADKASKARDALELKG